MNNIIVKNLGMNIKKLRKSKKLSQEALADKIGVNIRQISRLETGTSFISAETIYNLCLALKVQPYDLFNFKLDEIVEISRNAQENKFTYNLSADVDKSALMIRKSIKSDSSD